MSSESDFCRICGAWNIPVESVNGAVLTNEEYLALESQALRDLGASLSPQELEEVEVVRPEVLERWRMWGVPEPTIEVIIQQRRWVMEQREVEGWVEAPELVCTMRRLNANEAERWGFSKVVDTEGSIDVRTPKYSDRINGYRYLYMRPRIRVRTETYPLMEEIANMTLTWVKVELVRVREYVRGVLKTRTYLMYIADAHEARAVRICYLIEPYLTIPEKLRRAREILIIYKERSTIRVR